MKHIIVTRRAKIDREPRCLASSCNELLSSRDIANGMKYHTEACYLSSICDTASDLLDDPEGFEDE